MWRNTLFGSTAQTLWSALLTVGQRLGWRTPILDDEETSGLTYFSLVLRSLTLATLLRPLTERGENVGVLLPSRTGAVVTFFALQASGRVPAMLNFTLGQSNLRACLVAAAVKTILTSRRFVAGAEQYKVAETLAMLTANGMRVVYLEDLRASVTLVHKLRGLLGTLVAGLLAKRGQACADKPAVVLFTSGSSGVPRGVVLSHRNLLTNVAQSLARMVITPQDKSLNILPIFHSFGLTAGTLVPLLAGARCYHHPAPLQYKVVPELVAQTQATFMCATDTFLSGYAKNAVPAQLHTLRAVIAGGERLREETRLHWLQHFGVNIYQGYGCTETAPVLAVNTPDEHRPTTVGRLLPGLEYRLNPVAGLAEGGTLVVKGDNVMLGTLLADEPGVLQALPDGWYDTGDVVTVNADGYVTIKGRRRRFAKIAGEMISLAAIEDIIQGLWPNALHVACSVADDRKGEAIALLTEQPYATREPLIRYFEKAGCPMLQVPRYVFPVLAIPVLGAGKVDLAAAQRLAEDLVLSLQQPLRHGMR